MSYGRAGTGLSPDVVLFVYYGWLHTPSRARADDVFGGEVFVLVNTPVRPPSQFAIRTISLPC